MALQVWLPLRGDLKNQGLSDLTFSITSSTETTVDNNGKLGKCYSQSSLNGSGGLISNKTIDLGQNQSMFCWFKFVDLTSSSSLGGGLVSQHRYPSNQGMGITIRYVSSTTGYLSVNTGNGSSRTYNNYYGTTLLQANTWYHGGYTYDGSTLKIYVNGNCEKTQAITGMSVPADYISCFNWSMASTSGAGLYGGYKLHGSLNDVRIYDHCLSPMEVKELSKGLVLHYPLNDPYIESTTNLVPNSRTFNGWSSYDSGYTSIGENDLCGTSIICTNKNTWCGAYRGITLPSTGTYTISCYVKPISRTSTSLNQTVYTSGGGIGDTNVAASWDEPGKWQRISMTRTYSSTSITLYLIAYGGTRGTDKVSCEWTLPQIEKLDHMTPFTDGSRSENTIYDVSGFRNNGTISGNLTVSSNTPKYNYSIQMPAATTISHVRCLDNTNQEWSCAAWVKPTTAGNYQNLNNFNESNRLYHSTYPLLYLNSGTNDYYNYGNLALPINQWSHIVFVFKNSTGTKLIYINGENHTDTSGPNKTSTPKGIPDTVIIGGGNYDGGLCDYREYATALSADDVKSLYQNSAYIDSSGNVYGAVHMEA